MSATQFSSTPRTAVWVQRLRVEFEYPVLFTRGMLELDNPALRTALRPEPGRRARVFVLLDSGVVAATPGLVARLRIYFDAHADLELVGEPVEVVGGERAKNDAGLVARLQARFFAAKLDRHCRVLIIGGGAVLDAAGLAAALTHRGLRIVRAPTTVLGQNDAGIGVKTGINAFGHKNALGSFAPPFAVINDLEFISTLAGRDRIAGAAEAVKVALIRDAELFRWLEANATGLYVGAPDPTAEMIRRCAELHLTHMRESGDPFESGSARPLDFAHWAAHRLELASNHALRHGEAVAIGIALDTRYGALIGRLGMTAANRVEALLHALGLPRWHACLGVRGDDGRLAVLAGLEEFREHLGGELSITLLEDIGRSYDANAIDEVAMAAAVEYLRERARPDRAGTASG